MGLTTYIIRRLILIIPVILGVVILIFAISTLIPVRSRAMLYITSPRQLDRIDEIIEKYHLNDPVYVQFGIWLNELLHGNLGWSQSNRPPKPVAECIITKFPATFELVMFAIPITIFLGIYLGVISAIHKDTIVDHVTRFFAIIGWSLPSFWLAILLIAIFYVDLGWFLAPGRVSNPQLLPTTGFHPITGVYTIDGILNGRLDVTIDALRHLVMPVTVLVVIQVALFIRVMRSSMLEALAKGYIITARAKGLKEKEVINRHARRNALIPVVTLAGLMVAGMITGVVITETVFGVHGLGQWAANAAINTDVPSVLGFAMFTAIVFVLANLIVDILYAYIDPRIRLD